MKSTFYAKSTYVLNKISKLSFQRMQGRYIGTYNSFFNVYSVNMYIKAHMTQLLVLKSSHPIHGFGPYGFNFAMPNPEFAVKTTLTFWKYLQKIFATVCNLNIETLCLNWRLLLGLYIFGLWAKTTIMRLTKRSLKPKLPPQAKPLLELKLPPQAKPSQEVKTTASGLTTRRAKTTASGQTTRRAKTTASDQTTPRN